MLRLIYLNTVGNWIIRSSYDIVVVFNFLSLVTVFFFLGLHFVGYLYLFSCPSLQLKI